MSKHQPASLYIDLNHWINLAKARKAGDLELENRIADLVEAGKITVPVSSVHIMEIASILKEAQKTNLSQMLKAISSNKVLLSMYEVRRLEAANLVIEYYKCGDKFDVPNLVIKTGYLRAFGEPSVDYNLLARIDPIKAAEFQREVESELDNEGLLDLMLSEYVPKIGSGSPEHKKLVASMEETRTKTGHIPLATAEVDCVMGLTTDFGNACLEAAKYLHVTMEQIRADSMFRHWTKETLAAVPTLNTWSKLNFYMARSMGREMTINDLYDLGHCAVALPYCDYLVADSAMAHIMTFRGLEKHYNTKVYSNLTECISQVEQGL